MGHAVNAVEQAIRAALAKGDASEQTFRRRIYGSASAALERSLNARAYTEAEITTRRQSLLATIKHIETEFLIAVERESPVTPTVSAYDERTSNILDVLVAKPEAAGVETPVRRERVIAKPVKISPQRKPRRWLIVALNISFLLALVIGGFWAYSEGKRIYAEATTSKPDGLKPALAETGAANAADVTDWVQIFSARDTDLLTAAPRAKAEITSRDGLNYVVMSGDDKNEVAVKIGAGLTQTFAGKRVLFNIKARSTTGAILDMGLHCAFGADTKCERKRFKIGPQSTEYMFAVSVSNSASGDAALLIAPDLTGGGGAVEIENIRATIVLPDAG